MPDSNPVDDRPAAARPADSRGVEPIHPGFDRDDPDRPNALRQVVRSDRAVAADFTQPPEDGGPPATIEVPNAPGHSGSMQVVVAAEVLRRVNRTRMAVSLASQVIIRAYEEEALHAEVCRHLVTHGGYLMAWIGIAEETGERLVRPVAHAGLEPNFLNALKITWSNDLANRSPTSRAIQEHRPHVARNILKEPRFAVLRQDAQLYGYTATCALPLQFAQYGMGALTIHAMEPDAFNAEEVSLLRELANDLVAGVIAMRERGKRRALEQRLAALVDAADDAIIGRDIEGRVTDWNAGATRLFGHERSEVLGRHIVEFLVPEDRREEDARVQEAVARGERVPRFETMRVCKAGLKIHTSLTVSPIFADGDIVIGSTAIEHDITAVRAAEAGRRAAQMEEAEVMRLKHVDQMRMTFMSEASHELNTPLTPLRIHVEALAEAEDLSPTHRDHLVVIERNVLRLANLVKDMLEASRLETGRFNLDVAEHPLAVVLNEVVQSLTEVANDAKVELELGTVTHLFAKIDRNRVVQVLHNLVTNAISFTPAGGRIRVTARTKDGLAEVRVTDTGIGLSPEQLGLLFRPFSRPHEGQGSAAKGTGLGLFISKGIIEQHGGRIWAESAGPQQGSTFAFTLPLASATAPGRSDVQARTSAGPPPAARLSTQGRVSSVPPLPHPRPGRRPADAK